MDVRVESVHVNKGARTSGYLQAKEGNWTNHTPVLTQNGWSKIKSKTIKVLEAHESKCSLTWVRQSLLRYDTKSIVMKKKVDKLDFMKIKNICASNDTIKKV